MPLDATTVDHGQRAEQETRFTRLYCAVVMQVLDDAIADQVQVGPEYAAKAFTAWFWSADGNAVLMYAGVNRTNRALAGMLTFIRNGVPTGRALTLVSKGLICWKF